MIVGCLYLPNGNPAPGPKFGYKLRWFDRLAEHAGSLLASGAPVVLAGDYNVMPTDLDVYAPERWVDDALFRPEVRDAYRRLVAQGWTDALRALHPDERILHVLEVFPQRLRSQCRSAHRSSASQSAIGEASHRSRRGPGGARPRKGERSCTRQNRTCGAGEGIAGPAASENGELR
jgi:hypothetical protein